MHYTEILHESEIVDLMATIIQLQKNSTISHSSTVIKQFREEFCKLLGSEDSHAITYAYKMVGHFLLCSLRPTMSKATINS